MGYKNIKTVIDQTVMAADETPYQILRTKWEHQLIYINRNYKSIVGYIDLLAEIRGEFYMWDIKEFQDSTWSIFIEVKTKIPNLGELIRQMRAYQAFADSMTHYVIVSPDDRHSDILRQQGFHFFKYQDPGKLF